MHFFTTALVFTTLTSAVVLGARLPTTTKTVAAPQEQVTITISLDPDTTDPALVGLVPIAKHLSEVLGTPSMDKTSGPASALATAAPPSGGVKGDVPAAQESSVPVEAEDEVADDS